MLLTWYGTKLFYTRDPLIHMPELEDHGLTKLKVATRGGVVFASFDHEIESLEELSRFQPIWVDLESPTLEEKRWINQHFGLLIPEDAMDEDIEESARFYEEDNGELHIRSDFLIAHEDEPRTVRVAFIINQHQQT